MFARINHALLYLLLLGSIYLFSKNILQDKEAVIWDKSNVILPVHPIVPASSHSIRYEGLSGRIIKTVAVPTGAFFRDCLDGTLYAYGVTREKDPIDKDAELRRHILWRREGDDWVIDAMIGAPRAVFFPITPLKNGKYLLVASRPFMEDENGAYLFGIYKKNKKNLLELDRPLADVFSKPHWKKSGNRTYSLKDSTNVGLPYVCRTDTKIVACFPEAGWFFVFNAEDGRFIRKASVFPEITEDAIQAGKEFGPVGMGFEPRQDGRIVLATMTKEFALLAKEMFPKPEWKPEWANNDSLLMDHFNKNREIEDKRRRKWPNVVWWEFDPDTGRFTKMAAPEGFPTKVETRDEAWNYFWRIRADGTLVWVDRNGDITDAPKKQWKILELFNLR